MTFQLEDINIDLIKEPQGVRLITSKDNLLLPNQTLIETEEVVRMNFLTVKEFYQSRSNGVINPIDLNLICLKIVLHFFYMHNMWRNEGKKLKNKNMKFLVEDLEHSYSFNEIISVLKDIYPADYQNKCRLLLNMTFEAFNEYEKSREDFYNK